MSNDRERAIRDDEIDLIELIRGLWQQKLLIIFSTLVVSGIAVAYALLSKPIYEVRVFVQPPSQNDIAHLNYGRGGDSGLSMLSVKDVYEIYLRSLQSESLRREFFRSIYVPSLTAEERAGSQDELYARFQAVLLLGGGGRDNPTRYFVKINLPDPQLAAEWAVRYVEMAGRHGRDEVITDIKADATVKANNLKQEITAARESARKQREDEIIQLNEALRVAKSIGLEQPPIISNSLSGELSAGMGGALTYMRGSKALEAEIDNLRKRASDDPFVSNLRERQEAMGFYRGMEVSEGVVQVYRQDGAIESPDRPIKPRKPLIIGLGFVIGVTLGVVLALLRGLNWGVRTRE